MKTNMIDINCDLGESYGAFSIGQDDLMMPYITSANIACGYHAGDHNRMNEAVKQAAANDVALGAHPGFQDLMGFGRRPMQVDTSEIYNMVVYQISAVKGFAEVNNCQLQHVKPHGALYNMASKNREMAEAIARAIYDIDPQLILYGLAGSELVKMGEKVGLTVAEEVFADRTYQPDGSLTSRTEKNALIEDADKAVQRVIRMVKEGKVEAVDGSDIAINVDTICVHGDGEKALEFVQKLWNGLSKSELTIQKAGYSLGK